MDFVIAARAGSTHGVIGGDELLSIGLSAKQIARRVRDGWLTELFLGAFLMGHHNVTRRTYWKAATISCRAPLAFRAAAQLYRLADLIPGPSHVLVPHDRKLHRPGIVIHRTRDLPPSQVTAHHGIPVTTPERTLVDFASAASPAELRDAVRAARRKELLNPALTARMSRESRGRRGTDRLLALLAEDLGPVAETDSPREDLFLPICADFGIRWPEIHAPVLDYEVDCLWLPERLVVELDGWDYHRDREKFESDRRRDIELGLAGFPVQRYTSDRLTQEREIVARDVQAMLTLLQTQAGDGEGTAGS